MKKVKLGFIGCGFMGQLAHLKNYTVIDNCEVVALCDKKHEQAKLVAERYGVPKVYEDYNELLANPEIEAVVAAQPFDNYINIVPEVLKAKKHLLTEKPLCIYPENGEKLSRLAAENGVIHMVAYHKRSDPATEYAVSLIEKWKTTGEMGKMKYVRLTAPDGDWTGGAYGALITDESPGSYIPEPFPQGFDAQTYETYYYFVENFVHQVNYIRLLFGEDYKLTYVNRSRTIVAVESESGVCGLIEIELYSTTDDWQEHILVAFEKGWIRIELPAPLAAQQSGKISFFDNSKPGGVLVSPRLPNVCAMRIQAERFIKAVLGEKKAPCLSDEAVKDLNISKDYYDFIQSNGYLTYGQNSVWA